MPPSKAASKGDIDKQKQLETQFFLYSQKLNENATKNLRKAATNKEERQVLATIFGIASGMPGSSAAQIQQQSY